MSRDVKTYNFKSVGESLQEMQERRFSFVEEHTPLGIATPIRFTAGASSTFLMTENPEDMIKDNLKNLIATNYGERLFFPDYGANLRDLASDIGTEDGDTIIMSRLNQAVAKYMPYVNLVNYQPVRKLSRTGNITKLGMVVNFSVPRLGLDDISINITMYEAV